MAAEQAAKAKADADRQAAEKLAREKAEADRLAQEKAAKEKAEAARLAAEMAASEKAAAERVAAEQAAKAKADAERQAAEKLAREKADADRLAQEKAAKEKAEAARLAAEMAASEKAAAERVAAEQAAKAKADAERQAAEKLAREKADADRLAQQKAAQEKAEAERLAIEKAFREKAESERLAVEKAFREKVEQERVAAEKAARQERVALEKPAAPLTTVEKTPFAAAAAATAAGVSATVDQLRAAKEAAEKLVAEKGQALAELQQPAEQKGLGSVFLRERSSYRKEAVARATAEKAAAEKDLADAQSALDRALSGQAPAAPVAAQQAAETAAAKAAQEAAEADRLAAEKARREKVEAERLAAERAAKEKADQERLAADKAKRETAEAARLAADQAAKAKSEAERLAAEKAAGEKAAAEQAAKAEAERLAQERAAREKADAQRLAAEKAVREQAETERAAAAQAAKAKAEAEQLAAAEAAAIKQAAERIIKGKTEEERLAEEKDVAEQARQAAILLEVSKAKAVEKARKQAELEAQFKADDQAKAEEARRDAERIAREREEKEQQSAEKLAAAKVDSERLAREKSAKEKAEAERLVAEKAARVAAEKSAREKAESERVAREKEDAQRLAAEKDVKEKAEKERLAAAEKSAREKAAKEEAAAKGAREKVAVATAPAVKPAPVVPKQPAAAPVTPPAAKKGVKSADAAKRAVLRERAIAEYKSLIDRYPGSKAAALATTKLREMGIAYPSAGVKAATAPAAAAAAGENAKVLSLEVGQYSDLDFAVSPDAPSYEVGKQLAIPFEIINRGNSRDSFTLDSSFPAEYGLQFVAPGAPDKPLTRSPQLDPGEKFKGVALLTIPSRYIDGEKVIFPVKVASEFDPVVSQSRGISLIASSPLLRAVIKTDKVQILPGERVPYKVTLLNIGSAAARQLTMRLTYPPQYEPVDLAATGFREEGKGAVAIEGLQLASGESREFSIAFRLKDEALARQELFVRAETDNLSLKRKDAFLSAAAVVQPVSGVVVAAHSGRVVVIPGQTATVPLTVTNTGNIRDDFALKPVMQPGLAYAFYLDLNRDGVRQANEPIINHVGPLAPKEVANVVLEISSSAAEKDGVTVPLTLAFEPESDKGKGASVAVSMVYSRPVVNLAMAGKGGKMKPGQVSTFELDCGNSGSSLAKIVEIQSLVPEQIELVASDPGFSKGSNGSYVWKFEELGAGEKRSIKVTYRVKSGTAMGTSLQLTNVLKYQDRLGNVY